MLVLFMAVTGVIYTGIATPTEAVGHRRVRRLPDRRCCAARPIHAPRAQALLRAAQTTCMIIMIILGAHIFGYFFTLTQTHAAGRGGGRRLAGVALGASWR